ncbi:BON domain-containing protein [Thalassoglobus polymorphus]|uniref:BON domain protein n=1 Tax=Thalassoglobus polymorphus TaxID=2527994 RepID=A0A517QGY2_9PLAN|nr:BON domain-containing protein [Thalassoglobus polymorphus]QDT30888.1 BON domain protein [Thalassoglobus polymorphus]
MLFRTLSLTLVLVCFTGISDVHAQSLFGGGGTGGTTGGTNTGGRATGTTGAQGQSTSGIDTGQTIGTTNLNAADGSLSATVGQGSFVGGQNSGTFVGNRFTGQTASQGTSAQFGGLQNNNQTQNRSTQQQTDRKSVRPVFRMAFVAPTLPQQEIESRLIETAIALPPIVAGSSSINIQVDPQGQVTLSGAVGTERERKLLESYVRMEPGVRGVKNSLTIKE